MQTSFTQEQLRRPEIAKAATILKDCVHYGFCTAVCPTYVLLRDENDSPRGRIDLIRAMLEKGGPPDPKTVLHLDRCLSCNSCMTTCAAKVDYMHLADIGRAYIERNFRRPLGDRILRNLLANVLTHPERFRAAVYAARLASPFASLLPQRVRNLMMLARQPLPSPGAPAQSGTFHAQGERKARVALLTGCVQQAMAPHINAATIRLLTRHGCEVVVAAAAGCCGALPLHIGMEDRARANGERLLRAWAEAERVERFDAFISTASGCGTTIKDYEKLFPRETPIGMLAASVAQRALDVSELIQQIGLKQSAQGSPVTVVYHDACSLQHAQRVTEPPRQLLRKAGFRVVDVPERHFCCGSAGTYNMLQPELARELGLRKAKHVDSTGADILAAGNLGCLIQIALYSSKPAVHTVELLDWATGGPVPPALSSLPLPRSDKPDASVSSQAAADGNAIW